MVVVLYYGALREHVGFRRESIPVSPGVTVGGFIDHLCVLHPVLERYRHMVKVAVNEDFAPTDQIVIDRDVVALIPPVAGGADPYCVLSDRPLSIDETLAAVTGPGQGGVVVFIGVVRDHNEGHDVVGIEYEAYDAMVLKTFAEIVARCEATAPQVRAAIAHRKGSLKVGDAAVVIAASAPHRAEAFEAARLCIELLKQEVPIWKKEVSPSGTSWIGFRP